MKHDSPEKCESLVQALMQRFSRGDGTAAWPTRLSFALGLQGRLKVVKYDVRTCAYPGGSPPLRVAFAVDFHAGPTTHPAIIEKACEALQDARADLVLLGGDFVACSASDAAYLAERLRKIEPQLGKFAVLGNHDLRADHEKLKRVLQRAGVITIINTNVILPSPYDFISVCGLDDHIVGQPAPRNAFARAAQVRIVLAHSPSALLDIAGHDFDVAFCGHTHGGQVALPGPVPIMVPRGKLCRKFSYGRYDIDAAKDRTLIVSRGIGCSILPVRLFSDPEVVLCTIASRSGE